MEHQSHFMRQMEEVKEDLLGMAGLVEAAIQDSFNALITRSPGQAHRVLEGDRRIDLMENQIDEKAIVLLATRQPVAADLRFLSSTLRIVSFLERMGDQAVNLAWRAITLSEFEPFEDKQPLVDMYEIARDMTRDCLDAYARRNVEEAREVIKRDDALDHLNRQYLEDSILWMNQDKRLMRRGVELILASRHIERIGDEATNIAEEVVYLVEGEVIRHSDQSEDDETSAP
jgi:phosphate transport system protein